MAAAVFREDTAEALPYRIFKPAPKQDAQPFLILFLHGAGERGRDNRAQLRHGIADLLKTCRSKHGILVAPQCPRGSYWPQPGMRRRLKALLDELLEDETIDRRRIYLTGLSMGGMGTWDLAMDHPELFAAALPICGRADPRRAARLSQMPVWAFHGDKDRAVKVSGSRRMITAMKQAGGDPRYQEYPGVGHNSWTRTYANPKVRAWLVAQRRPVWPRLEDGGKVVFFGDSITFAGAKEGGYIRRLEATWKELGDAVPRLDFVGAGVSGNKVPDLLARLDRDVLQQQPSLVVIYIGTNDVWHSLHEKGTPLDRFRNGLLSLIAQIRAAKAGVMLCTPAAIGELPRGENKLDGMLERYAAAIRAVAREQGCPLVDLRDLFVPPVAAREAAVEQPPHKQQGILTSDGVHLNAAGNQRVAAAIQSRLLQLR